MDLFTDEYETKEDFLGVLQRSKNALNCLEGLLDNITVDGLFENIIRATSAEPKLVGFLDHNRAKLTEYGLLSSFEALREQIKRIHDRSFNQIKEKVTPRDIFNHLFGQAAEYSVRIKQMLFDETMVIPHKTLHQMITHYENIEDRFSVFMNDESHVVERLGIRDLILEFFADVTQTKERIQQKLSVPEN